MLSKELETVYFLYYFRIKLAGFHSVARLALLMLRVFVNFGLILIFFF